MLLDIQFHKKGLEKGKNNNVFLFPRMLAPLNIIGWNFERKVASHAKYCALDLVIHFLYTIWI